MAEVEDKVTMEEGQDDDANDEEESSQVEMSGWADSIAKILKSGKPKKKKELILSRARKDYEVNKFKQKEGKKKFQEDTFEIVRAPKVEKEEEEEKTIKVEDDEDKKDDNILSLKMQRKLELKQKKLERAWENLSRMSAEKTDPQFERDMLKMATKGVVQLFNAISMQQKTIKTKLRETKKSEFAKDKVLHQTKDIFDSALTKSKREQKASSSGLSGDVKIKEESDDDAPTTRKRKSDGDNSKSSKRKPAWTALQDDFMLDAKLKDWDKDSSSGSSDSE